MKTHLFGNRITPLGGVVLFRSGSSSRFGQLNRDQERELVALRLANRRLRLRLLAVTAVSTALFLSDVAGLFR